MANIIIAETSDVSVAPVASPIPVLAGPGARKTPIIDPGGSAIGGGATVGQLFPVGNR